MVLEAQASPSDTSRSIVVVQILLDGGGMVQFRQELANLYQPAPGSPDAERLVELRQGANVKHASRIPKIQLPLSAGCIVAVLGDLSNPSSLSIDEDALHASALNEYIRDQKARQPKPADPITGPPWEVPAVCPNCGAPVDQATASAERDPHCRFCEQPIPVKPLARPRPGRS